jgi:hypothetical protein
MSVGKSVTSAGMIDGFSDAHVSDSFFLALTSCRLSVFSYPVPVDSLPPLPGVSFLSPFPSLHILKNFHFLFIHSGLTVLFWIDRLVRKFGQHG